MELLKVQKLVGSILILREHLAVLAVCGLLVISANWITSVWWPAELEYKSKLIELLQKQSERLVAIEKILER